MIERISTQRLAPQQRLDFWNRVVGETYEGLLVDSDVARFDAAMLRWRLDDMTMIWPQSCGATVRRRREAAQAATSQKLVVHIAQEATPILTERGRELAVRPGDMVVCAAEEAYQWQIGGQHEMLVVEFERSRLDGQVHGIDDCVARVIARERPTTRLLHRFVLSLWREGGSELDRDAARSYADSLSTMIATALTAREDAAEPGDAGLVRRMQAMIAAHVADPALSPAQIAVSLGVSLRTLQVAAAAAGTTPRHAITEHRLMRAAEELRLSRSTPITTIALDSGFADSAHFARRFQERFGMSPTEYRRAG